jgi:hypothetical protein
VSSGLGSTGCIKIYLTTNALRLVRRENEKSPIDFPSPPRDNYFSVLGDIINKFAVQRVNLNVHLF